MAINYMRLAGEIQDPIKFPDEALQRMVKSPNPAMPMEQSLAMGEWMRRQKLRQGAQGQGAEDPRTVKDMVLQAAQQKAAMENNPAIQNYPQPQMDTRGTVSQVGQKFAGGGLVAFAEGGPLKKSGTFFNTGPLATDLPASGAEIANAPNVGDTVFGSPIMEGWQSIKNTVPDTLNTLFEKYKQIWPPAVALRMAKSAFSNQAAVAPQAPPRQPISAQIPGEFGGIAGSQPVTTQVQAAPAPTNAMSGIAAAKPDQAAFVKDLIGEKPEVEDLEKYHEEQAKFWEKHLGKDGYKEEKEQIKKDRERADELHENSKAYAMLSAAGAMTNVRTPGLAGFLEGLGRAASTATPVLMKGDEDYDRMVKEAHRAALEIKKGERAEALGKMTMAESAYQKAQDRLEHFNERRMQVLTQLELENKRAASAEKVAGIHAKAYNRNPQLDLLEALQKDPKLAELYKTVHGVDVKSTAGYSTAMNTWLKNNPSMLMRTPQEQNAAFLQAHPEWAGLGSAVPARVPASSLGLD